MMSEHLIFGLFSWLPCEFITLKCANIDQATVKPTFSNIPHPRLFTLDLLQGSPRNTYKVSFKENKVKEHEGSVHKESQLNI